MEVSSYAHSPYGEDTARNTVKLPIDDVVPWVKAAQVPKEYAIALHSRVWKGENEFHLPMIDFSTNVLSNAMAVGIELRDKIGMKDFELLRTGRSFHLYGYHLLTTQEWIRFMGEILLFNHPGSQDVVDTRWVGHRLIAGYGSLRVTALPSLQKPEPTLVRG